MKYIQNFWRYRFLLGELVKKGIKLKYRRSYLGIIWSLLEPIMTTMVLTVVFGTLFNNKDKTFPLYILTGRLLYSYFSQSTKAALRSIRANSRMIKKVYVPKYLYPLSSVLFNYVIFLISLSVLVILGFVVGVYPAWYWIKLVLPLSILLVMTYGVGMILSTIAVFFRDMEYLWDVFLMIIMYTCAIFYSPERLLKSGHAWVLKVNPLYGVIGNTRNIVYGNSIDWSSMVYAIAFSLLALAVGLYVFHKKQDEFILQI